MLAMPRRFYLGMTTEDVLAAAHALAEAAVAVQGDGGVGQQSQHQPHGGALVAVDAQQTALLHVAPPHVGHHHQWSKLCCAWTQRAEVRQASKQSHARRDVIYSASHAESAARSEGRALLPHRTSRHPRI
ncbi:uncharacterized protein LOC134528414 [Bacillus rossius redtenbacheri]|uniref:uncharacterized protein LOC134528414 n=1 Tax=Bacillus rossius redtenbacheri TaxID=93214 RepID=UPI002FDEBDD6